MLGACGQKFDFSQPASTPVDENTDGGLLDYIGGNPGGSSGTEVTRPFGNGTVQMDWGLDNGKVFQSGLGASKLTTFLEDYGHTYCFENTRHLHQCQAAKTSIRDVIDSEPVAIQGFQFNFSKQSHNRNEDYQSIVIEGGWVATAELRFDTATGRMVLGNANVQKVHEGTCDLADTSSGFTVGYFDPTRVLTGLYLADEYVVSHAAYTDAHIKAARVWYSGLVPDPRVATANSSPNTCNSVFCWKFEAPDKATTSDFGAATFQDSSTSVTSKLSGYFGTTAQSAVPRWDSHVVIGFCLKGHKIEKTSNFKRPLLHYVVARTHQPRLVFKR